MIAGIGPHAPARGHEPWTSRTCEAALHRASRLLGNHDTTPAPLPKELAGPLARLLDLAATHHQELTRNRPELAIARWVLDQHWDVS